MNILKVNGLMYILYWLYLLTLNTMCELLIITEVSKNRIVGSNVLIFVLFMYITWLSGYLKRKPKKRLADVKNRFSSDNLKKVYITSALQILCIVVTVVLTIKCQPYIFIYFIIIWAITLVLIKNGKPIAYFIQYFLIYSIIAWCITSMFKYDIIVRVCYAIGCILTIIFYRIFRKEY